MTRLQSFAARVTREMLNAWCEPGSVESESAAVAILERELRAFVSDYALLTMNVLGNALGPDAYLDSPHPEVSTPTKPCEPWCGTRDWPDAISHLVWFNGMCGESTVGFCTPACRDAGRPLNPRGTCETHGLFSHHFPMADSLCLNCGLPCIEHMRVSSGWSCPPRGTGRTP